MSATSNGTSTRERPRVYTGRSIEELIPKIERELGEDAIVTRQRSGLGGGVAGFFQRPFVEIEAHPGHPRIDLYDEGSAGATAPADASAIPLLSERFATALAAAQSAAEPVPAAVPAEPVPASVPPTPPALQTRVQRAYEPAQAAAAVPMPAPAGGADAARVRAKLLERGIEADLADELIELACAHTLAGSPSQASVAEAVKAVLRRRIVTPTQWAATGVSVAVVGPPGAGKTSFCAALAGAYRERSTLTVACATLLAADDRDEHRLLLSPHLRTPTPAGDQHAVDALARARSEGLLLLDTPSIPSGEKAATARLGALLKRLEPDHVVLALPATHSTKAGVQLLRALRGLRPTSVAITHTAETDQLGAAVQTTLTAGIAPAFLLDSRRPSDLRQTDPADLAKRLLG
ncbi:MAG TPA: hypothetical protein VGH21_03420 [Solirubrobacteraceae bacterium]|jgi:flagellar biosynthesis GTPase FlhF